MIECENCWKIQTRNLYTTKLHEFLLTSKIQIGGFLSESGDPKWRNDLREWNIGDAGIIQGYNEDKFSILLRSFI